MRHLRQVILCGKDAGIKDQISDIPGISVIDVNPLHIRSLIHESGQSLRVIICEREMSLFMDILDLIAESCPNASLSLRHPISLAEESGVNLKNHYLIIGANRSGSTLLFTIIKKLCELSTLGVNSTTHWFGDMARLHYELLTSFLSEKFAQLGADYCGTGAVTFNHMDFFGSGNRSCFFMSPLPIRRIFFDRVHKTYTPIDESIYDFCSRLEYNIFLPMRNPLDIIVSNAFEFESVYYKMFPGENLDVVESEFRDQYGKAQLSHIDWFRNMAIYVKRHMEACIRFKNTCPVVKYEDVLSNPMGEMKRIAELMRIPSPPEEQLTQIWENDIFDKPLASFKAHMFRPGCDKYRQYICREHIDILRKLKYPELMHCLGYQFPADAYISLHDICNQRSERLNLVLQVRDKGFYVQTGVPACLPSDSFKSDVASIGSKKIRFSTNFHPFYDIFKDLIRNDKFKSLISLLRP